VRFSGLPPRFCKTAMKPLFHLQEEHKPEAKGEEKRRRSLEEG
jgi:hypothetical protein